MPVKPSTGKGKTTPARTRHITKAKLFSYLACYSIIDTCKAIENMSRRCLDPDRVSTFSTYACGQGAVKWKSDRLARL